MMSVCTPNSQVWNQPVLAVMSRGSVENEYASICPGIVPPPTLSLPLGRSHSTGWPEQQLMSHGGIPSGAATFAMSGTNTGSASSNPENPFDVPGTGLNVRLWTV